MDLEVKIFDSHAHYDDEAFDEDRDSLLESLPKNGIGAVVNVGASLETSKMSLELAKKYPHVYAALGVHPENAAEVDDNCLKWISEHVNDERVVAVGEIGLDYHYEGFDKNVQWEAFERQLALAERTKLPLIIHSRDAAEDTLGIIKKHMEGRTENRENPGVIHCFSYSKEMAQEYLKMGFYIGIGGVVTFSNAKKLKEVAAEISLDRILLETDCPYLSPVPNRGKRNSSLNLPYVAAEIAKIRNISEKELIKAAWDNALRMYKISI